MAKMLKKAKAVIKKALPKAQMGTPKTAGQAYLNYVPRARAQDTLGTDDTRFRFPGFAERTENWPARNRMLDLTYGKSSVPSDTSYSGSAEYERVSQNPKDIKKYSKELKKAYKKGPNPNFKNTLMSEYKKGGLVKSPIKTKSKKK